MDKIYYEKILYRIIQGRLRLSFCDPVLYLYEPDKNILEESYHFYDEVYRDAYLRGVYIKDELKEVLFDNELWSPEDDKRAEDIEKQIEELKVEAFKNSFDRKQLLGIKFNIRYLEKEYLKYKSKFNSLDHVSCEGVAGFARLLWIVSKTIKDVHGRIVEDCDEPLTKILDYYNNNNIPSEVMRYIARNDPFRSMWALGRKQSNVFNRPTCELTRDQLSLGQYASMYDSVYESSESPDQEIIDDDDCLDGWFIVQKREYDKHRKKRQVESMLGNEKIANSSEVFIMANSHEAGQKIYDLNDPHARAIVKQRDQQIKDQGNIKYTDLQDVRQDIVLQARQQAISTIKGK